VADTQKHTFQLEFIGEYFPRGGETTIIFLFRQVEQIRSHVERLLTRKVKLQHMERTEQIDNLLEKKNADGFLIIDNSENSSFYYLTKLEVHDPVYYLRIQEKSVLMVPPIEYSRAEEEAEVDEVINTAEFEEGDIRRDKEAKFKALKELLKENSIEKLAVPENFSSGTADRLGEEGLEIKPVPDPVEKQRSIKTEEEIENLREAQKVTEQTMQEAEKILEESKIEGNRIYYQGEVLTSEKLKAELHKYLLDHGFELTDTVVASGKQSSDPHQTGSGPLKPHKPIIIDLFPRHPSGYHGDMTRTFVKGEASEKLKEMEKAVKSAQKKAFQSLEEKGVTGEEMNNTVCQVFEGLGFQTLRQGDIDQGFLHSVGHSIGLDAHEPPRLGPSGGELKPGMVLTIEPGLYNPEVGGLRFEDMVLVKEEGYENFNSMHKKMEID
jgi:Xaa-Pro aminopeptidase